MSSARIRFTTTPEVREALDALLKTGLYGRTINDVAERLVCKSLANMNVIAVPPFPQRRKTV